jgi:hypothetical protein
VNDKIKEIERRLTVLEDGVSMLQDCMMKLVESHSQQSHWMSMMARQVRQIAHEIDTDIEPPRMN